MIENRLVLGTVQLGLQYGIANKTGLPDEVMAIAIVHQAWENGIREFDTAQGYGMSETVLGQCLSELNIAQEAKIISKFDPAINHLDADEMSKTLDQSLSRLRVDSLFGMMLHKEDILSLWDQGLQRILEGFISSGMIQHVGVSVYSPEQAVRGLKRFHAACARATPELVDIEVRDADRANFPLLQQLLERTHRLVERDRVVRPMNLVEIDVLRLQSFQASRQRGLHVSPRRLPHRKLGRQHRPIPAAAEGAAHNFLGMSLPVYFGRVDQRDAMVQGGMDCRDRRCVVRTGPLRAAHGPCAECDD